MRLPTKTMGSNTLNPAGLINTTLATTPDLIQRFRNQNKYMYTRIRRAAHEERLRTESKCGFEQSYLVNNRRWSLTFVFTCMRHQPLGHPQPPPSQQHPAPTLIFSGGGNWGFLRVKPGAFLGGTWGFWEREPAYFGWEPGFFSGGRT